ncbi:hypothetical protein GFM01_32820 [Rhizobium laguerreae]|uniref:hypothetical protein n=1 Tax=Rhizobium laguerreae TaxID=1076926 RepID=UPI0014424BC0|nr:hypothetical protein [Rhizobium laguerreae]NKM22451.1 hypothetical protein [Rhizobium laguerreae]
MTAVDDDRPVVVYQRADPLTVLANTADATHGPETLNSDRSTDWGQGDCRKGWKARMLPYLKELAVIANQRQIMRGTTSQRLERIAKKTPPTTHPALASFL